MIVWIIVGMKNFTYVSEVGMINVPTITQSVETVASMKFSAKLVFGSITGRFYMISCHFFSLEALFYRFSTS